MNQIHSYIAVGIAVRNLFNDLKLINAAREKSGLSMTFSEDYPLRISGLFNLLNRKQHFLIIWLVISPKNYFKLR